MNAAHDRPDPGRLGIAAFVVVLAVFMAMRMLAIVPWTLPAFDVYAYWVTGTGFDYATAHQGTTGAYLYSPAFAQLIWPLTRLGWPLFAGIWTGIVAVPLAWLGGRYALGLLLLPPVFLTVACGQLDILFAVVAII